MRQSDRALMFGMLALLAAQHSGPFDGLWAVVSMVLFVLGAVALRRGE